MRIIYEAGLEVIRSDEGEWYPANAPKVETTLPLVPSEIYDKFALRPVLIAESIENEGIRDFLLTFGGDLLELKLSELYSAAKMHTISLPTLFALAYDIGAMVYHCKQLVFSYSQICRDHAMIRSTPGYPSTEAKIINFGHQTTPYYEFDALLSAARRSYDKVGHMLWQTFQGSGGGRPDDFAHVLARCNNLPEGLSKLLHESWDHTGRKLKDYRDCTQHFASTDIGFCTVAMKRIETEWLAFARIPDNPEVKSKRKFTYVSGLDALKYGWEVTNELVRVISEIFSQLPK